MWRLQIGCTKAHSEGTRVVRSGSVWVVLSPIAPLRNSKSPGGLRIAFWGRWIWRSCTMKMRSAQGATVWKTCRKKFEIELGRNELETRFACFRSTLLHWLTVTIVVVRSYDVSLVLRGFSCVFSFAIWVLLCGFHHSERVWECHLRFLSRVQSHFCRFWMRL